MIVANMCITTRRLGLLTAAAALLATTSPSFAEPEQQPIPRNELKAKCGLDPDIMAGVDQYLLDGTPYVVFRNGHFCWRSSSFLTDQVALHSPREVFSTTKSFGAVLVGYVAARSSLRDTSLLSDWLTPGEIATYNPLINPQARVAHVLAMTSTGPSLANGKKIPWTYDALGLRELNILIPVMNRVIEREPENFAGARNVREVAQTLFNKLGMTRTTWAGQTVALSLQSTPADLARLGELVLRRGRWNGEVLIQEQYLYRMTHASFEDSNNGLGYMLYLNAANRLPTEQDANCAPYVRWPRYPHAPFFETTNSAGGYPFGDATATLDTGIVWSSGANDSAFVVHRGLDMVLGINPLVPAVPLVASQFLVADKKFPNTIWNNIRPAMLAEFPEFGNNDRSFCNAYRSGSWAQMSEAWSATASQ